MRQLILIVLLLSCGGALAGTITGTVRAQGKEGTEAEAGSDKYGSRKFKFVERINYSELHDFVVYIDQAPAVKPLPPDKPVQVVTTRRITQKGAAFTPSVLPVVVGTVVEWPNHDDIYHNVFSISEAKEFDLGLYKDPEVKRITFDKPGRVDVFCSIHSAMNCTVLVLQNSWYATTDEKGNYEIHNVPPGTYKVKAWHRRLPSEVKEITVSEKGKSQLDFALGIKNLPKY